MTITNHWGKYVNSEEAITGVYSWNSLAWEFIDDEICLTCEEILQDIESDETLDEDEKEHESEYLECDSSHEKIIGNWIKNEEGLYTHNPDGEFAAIVRETAVQVIWSKHTARGDLCSPCFPGQADADSSGGFLYYALPEWAIYKAD